jgi:hypothetical protein
MTADEVRSLALDGDDVVCPAWLDQSELGDSSVGQDQSELGDSSVGQDQSELGASAVGQDQSELGASAVGPAVELDDLIAEIKSVSLRFEARERLNRWFAATTTAADLGDELAEITMNFHRQRGGSVGNVATVATVLTERLTVAFKALIDIDELVSESDIYDAILSATKSCSSV